MGKKNKYFEILYYQDNELHKVTAAFTQKEEIIQHYQKSHAIIIKITELQKTTHHDKANFLLLYPYKHLNLNEWILFFYKFSLMLDSGIPLYTLLQNISHTHQSRTKIIATDILNALEQGKSLAHGFEKYRQEIGDLGIALIEVGEKSGHLSSLLMLLVKHLKRKQENYKKIKNSLIYPSFLIFAMILALGIIIGFLLPKFKELFESFNKELPLITKFLFQLENIFSVYALYLCALLFLLYIIYILYFKNHKSFRMFIDKTLLKIPIVCTVLNTNYLYFYFSTIQILFQSGFPLDATLKLSSKSISNYFLRDTLYQILIHINQGCSLYESMKKINIFDHTILELIKTGELSGELEKIMSVITIIYEEESKQQETRITALIEPTITAIMAFFVLILALGIFMPLWDLNSGYVF